MFRAAVVSAVAGLGAVVSGAGRAAPTRQLPTAEVAPAPPFARLYVYTRPYFRPRHAEIVRLALERRATTHVSGFADDDREPVLALGPVQGGVHHWRGRRGAGDEIDWTRGTSATRAWPFAAVLEYSAAGRPRAYVDWFRRRAGSPDPAGFAKDPADQRYAAWISDQVVCRREGDVCTMALVDTPTGDVIAGNEWVIRARVDWDDAPSASVRKGWWLRFADTQKRSVDDWVAELDPLVDWVPLRTRGVAGDFGGVRPVGDRERELAVIGTTTVFELPAIPDDVVPSRDLDR